jgi:phosphopentomutase
MDRIENILINKFKILNDTNLLVDNVLMDGALTKRIIARATVEQYVSNFIKTFQKKKNYYKRTLLEINSYVRNALILGYTNDEIYEILAKSDDTIFSILYKYEMYSFSFETSYKSYINKYINEILITLTYTEQEERKHIMRVYNKYSKTDRLTSKEKEEVLLGSIAKLREEGKAINYVAIGKISNKHPVTIRNYFKQLKLKLSDFKK